MNVSLRASSASESIPTVCRIVLCPNLFDVYATCSPAMRENWKSDDAPSDNAFVHTDTVFWYVVRVTGHETEAQLRTLLSDIALFIEAAEEREQTLHCQPIVCWTSAQDQYCGAARYIAEHFLQQLIVVDTLA